MLHREPVPGSEMGSLRYYTFPAHALMVSNIQAWEGAVALSTVDEATGFVSSNRFLPYVSNGNREVDVRFVTHYFRGEEGLDGLRAASPGTQVRNRTLNKRLFEATRIPLPPFAEQQRIADHLDRIEAGVARQRAAYGTHSGAWRTMIDRLAGLRSSSNSVKLADLLRERRGTPVEMEHRYAISGVYSFGRGMLRRDVLSGASTKYKTLTQLRKNDVVYSKLGAFEGAVAVVPESEAGRFVSPEFPVFEVSAKIDPQYLRFAMIAESFVAQLRAVTAGVGARQKRVSVPLFLQSQIPFPDMGRQREVARALTTMTSFMQKAQRASELRDALLPAARNEIFSALR